MEATLALATLVRAARLDLLPGPAVQPRAGVTTRPRGPVVATVEPGAIAA